MYAHAYTTPFTYNKGRQLFSCHLRWNGRFFNPIRVQYSIILLPNTVKECYSINRTIYNKILLFWHSHWVLLIILSETNIILQILVNSTIAILGDMTQMVHMNVFPSNAERRVFNVFIYSCFYQT